MAPSYISPSAKHLPPCTLFSRLVFLHCGAERDFAYNNWSWGGSEACICVLAEILSSPKKLTVGSQIVNPQITNQQITKKIRSANRESAKCRRSANLTNYLLLLLLLEHATRIVGILKNLYFRSEKLLNVLIISRTHSLTYPSKSRVDC
jgi:hypothetical protein